MKKEPVMNMLEIMQLHRTREILNASDERCLGFRTIPTPENAIPIGSSKVGGDADLPPSIAWPTRNDCPLDFLLQLDLAEIPEGLRNGFLPDSGLLSFFYDAQGGAWGFDPDDKGSWKVIFFHGEEDELVRTANPGSTHRSRYTPCAVEYYESLCPKWREVRDDPALSGHPYEIATFDNFVTVVVPEVPVHRIMGEPDGIQSSSEDMQRQCQFVSHGLYMGGSGGPAFDHAKAKDLEPTAKEWKLLLQLDSDSDPGMQWGDKGRLHFWIREQDLAERNFEDVWMILECV
jgi:uncharacterized protein YwqG